MVSSPVGHAGVCTCIRRHYDARCFTSTWRSTPRYVTSDPRSWPYTGNHPGCGKQQHTANCNCAAMSAVLSARQDVQARRSRSLLHDLRYLSSFCEVTDERDRVYAWLGFRTDAERSTLHVKLDRVNSSSISHDREGPHRAGQWDQRLLRDCMLYPCHWTTLLDTNLGRRKVSESLGSTPSADRAKTFQATSSARRTINISADG